MPLRKTDGHAAHDVGISFGNSHTTPNKRVQQKTMLFSSTALRNASRLAVRNATSQSRRTMASGSGGIPNPMLSGWYNIFGKTTIGYATWLVAGIIVAEGMTGALTDGIWAMSNSGRTYDTVDWSKFATEDDDDEDEDEEEEEEEEGGDDDDDDE